MLVLLLRFLLAPTKGTEGVTNDWVINDGVINDGVVALMNNSCVDVIDSFGIEYNSLVGNKKYASLVGNNNRVSSGEVNSALLGTSARTRVNTSDEPSFEAGKVVRFGSSINKSGRSAVINDIKSSKASKPFDEFLRVISKHWIQLESVTVLNVDSADLLASPPYTKNKLLSSVEPLKDGTKFLIEETEEKIVRVKKRTRLQFPLIHGYDG